MATQKCYSGKHISWCGYFTIKPIMTTSRKFATISDISYQIGNGKIVVPANFQFDGASSPRLLWPLFPPITNNELPAVILHDYLYENRIGSRSYADKLFLRLLVHAGVSRFRAKLMFLAVRVFGRRKWET